MKQFFTSILFFFLLLHSVQAGQVVVTIKPLHSLVSGVMEGDGNTLTLLVDGKASLHDFALKPSHMSALSRADAVFYIGEHFESFLTKTLQNLPATTKRVPMDQISGLTLLPITGGHEEYHHGHEHEHLGNHDLHLWMSTTNAKLMVQEIDRVLSAQYPEQKKLYTMNAKKLLARLDALHTDLTKRTKPLQGKPYVTFHNAYQYFEKTYGLTSVGSITLHPERGVSAKHLKELRAEIIAKKAVCVFREPQFEAAVMDNLLAGTQVKSTMLDPEAALIQPSPELYFTLMNNLASSMEACFSAK